MKMPYLLIELFREDHLRMLMRTGYDTHPDIVTITIAARAIPPTKQGGPLSTRKSMKVVSTTKGELDLVALSVSEEIRRRRTRIMERGKMPMIPYRA